MTNLVAYGGLAIGIGIWLHTLWRARTSIITKREEIDQNLTAVFFVYMGVAMFGFNFPLIERSSSAIIGTTPALIWISLISALLCALAFALYLRRFKQYSAVMMGISMFLMFLIFNGAYVTLFNGLADFKPAQKRIARVVDKKFHPGGNKYGPSYLLLLRDWNNPQAQIRFKTSPNLYRQTTIGDAIELQVKPGALGMEWIRDARRATF